MIDIFTDGSTINNGKKNALGGIGVYIPKYKYNLSLPFLLETPTNQKCELYAIIKALEYILLLKIENKLRDKNITIYTDSEYSINVCTKWISLWKFKKWITTEGKPVKNIYLIKNIDYILNLLKIKQIKLFFKHIRSHQDKPNKKDLDYKIWEGNNIVDVLAKNGTTIICKFTRKRK